jgi:hypothetical protein
MEPYQGSENGDSQSRLAVEPRNHPNDLGGFSDCNGIRSDLVGFGLIVELDRQLHYRIT